MCRHRSRLQTPPARRRATSRRCAIIWPRPPQNLTYYSRSVGCTSSSRGDIRHAPRITRSPPVAGVDQRAEGGAWSRALHSALDTARILCRAFQPGTSVSLRYSFCGRGRTEGCWRCQPRGVTSVGVRAVPIESVQQGTGRFERRAAEHCRPLQPSPPLRPSITSRGIKNGGGWCEPQGESGAAISRQGPWRRSRRRR